MDTKVRFSRFITLLSLIAVIISIFSNPSSALADKNGNQISFNVAGGVFTRLKISGLNQNNDMVTWTIGNGNKEMIYAETTGWWWKGTIVIEITGRGKTRTGNSWSGDRRCVIDYLKEPSSTNMVPVTYTDGAGCSGDAGNVSSPYRNFVLAFYKTYFGEEDSLRVLNEVSDAADSAQCLAAISRGLSVNGIGGTGMKIIKVGWECSGVGLNAINNILKKYNNKVVQ